MGKQQMVNAPDYVVNHVQMRQEYQVGIDMVRQLLVNNARGGNQPEKFSHQNVTPVNNVHGNKEVKCKKSTAYYHEYDDLIDYSARDLTNVKTLKTLHSADYVANYVQMHQEYQVGIDMARQWLANNGRGGNQPEKFSHQNVRPVNNEHGNKEVKCKDSAAYYHEYDDLIDYSVRDLTNVKTLSTLNVRDTTAGPAWLHSY